MNDVPSDYSISLQTNAGSVLKQAAIFPSKTFPIYNSKASYHQKLYGKVDENLKNQ